MITVERRVRFDEVDAAGLVFFPRFLVYLYDANDALFADILPGGHETMVLTRKIGVPTVKVDITYAVPLRYGDAFRCEVEVEHVGETSIALRHRVVRASDGAIAARATQVLVTVDLASVGKVRVPDDLRAGLERHLVAAGAAAT